MQLSRIFDGVSKGGSVLIGRKRALDGTTGYDAMAIYF